MCADVNEGEGGGKGRASVFEANLAALPKYFFRVLCFSTFVLCSLSSFCSLHPTDRLVGLVVKASASRAEDPGFESRLRRDFFGVESYQ